MTGVYNDYSFGLGNLGRTWAPKRQRLSVGRDVAPIQNAAPRAETGGIILADSARQLEAAQAAYAGAESRTRLGFSLKNSISVTPEGREQLLAKGGSESVYLVRGKDGAAGLRISGGSGADRFVALKQGEDVRVSWADDGKAEVFTGAAALSGGKLAAQGEGDILVRMSAAAVEAGNGSTVLNLAAKSGGDFSGGHNVRYLGVYENAVIEGGTGVTDFGGYFGNSRISAENGRGDFNGIFSSRDSKGFIRTGVYDDVFSGFFQVADVGEGKNRQAGMRSAGGVNSFSGTFMSGTSIESGEGNDTFDGRFFDAKITDKGGDNTFGGNVDLKNKINLNFVRTVIESGEGNDRFLGAAEESAVNLGGGDDEVNGVLLGSTLNAGDGHDKVKLLYARASLVDLGKGDDELHLVSGAGDSVRLGGGSDKMTSGLNADSAGAGAIGNFGNSAFLTETEAALGVTARFGHYFGDVRSTNIDAGEGENEISVHDGKNVHSVKSGENEPALAGEGEAASGRSSSGKAASGEASSGATASGGAASSGGGLEDVEILSGETKADMALQNSLRNTLRQLLERTRDGGTGRFPPDMKERMEQALAALEEERGRERSPEAEGDRFLTSLIGGWLPNPGGNSVTVTGGKGQSVSFDGMDRHFSHRQAREDNQLRASLRKYGSFGGVNS